MSFLSDIGGALFSAVTGTTTSDVEAEITAAEQQLILAVQAIIGLEAVIAFEMLFVVILLWKHRD